MNNLKQLVEDIIEYTKMYSITEDEWYWNVACTRKTSSMNETEITWDEFNVAIREEILYDLVFNNGRKLEYQMKSDLENYLENETYFINASKELEQKVQNVLENFKIEKEVI